MYCTRPPDLLSEAKRRAHQAWEGHYHSKMREPDNTQSVFGIMELVYMILTGTHHLTGRQALCHMMRKLEDTQSFTDQEEHNYDDMKDVLMAFDAF